MNAHFAMPKKFRGSSKREGRTGLLALSLIATLIASVVSVVGTSSVAFADTSSQKIAVPSYINPTADSQTWNSLIGSSSTKVGVVVVNVLNGPTYQKDASWADVIHRAHASGKRVLGYVDTGYLGQTNLPTRLGSTRAADWIAQAEQDINLWYSFYGSDIDGIFFDQGFNTCGSANVYPAWYSSLNQYVKRHHGGSMTVLNPGAVVPQCYENSADVLITYEGDYNGYYGQNANAALNYTDPGWTSTNPDKFWHIIYNVPAAQVAKVITTSKARHAGYVYVTDDVLANPYDTIPNPTYWQAEQNAVNGGTYKPAVAKALPTNQPAPTAPSSLIVASNGTDYTSAKLSWKAGLNASSYYIYVDGKVVANIPGTMTAVTIAGLAPGGRQYRFHVTAQGASGKVSSPSNGITVTTMSLPDGQTVTNAAAQYSTNSITFSANFLSPYAFRRVFIGQPTGTGHACWFTATRFCARYVIENSTLLEYAGDSTGTHWTWTPIAYTPPTASGYSYSWTIAKSQIPAVSTSFLLNADGYGPQTFVTPTDPDHSHGLSPGVVMASVAVLGLIIAVVTDGLAIPAEAAIASGEAELGAAELGAAEYSTVEDLAASDISEAGSASSEIATYTEGETAEAEEVASKNMPLCSVNSFRADTPILMGDGTTKSISQIRVGDIVRSSDPVTGQTENEAVSETFRNTDSDLLDIKVASLNGQTTTLHTTESHSFWDTSFGGWTTAQKLRIGDVLRTSDRSVAIVLSSTVLRGQSSMYDLTVDQMHSFFVAVGATAVLVHNAGCVDAAFDDEGANYVLDKHMDGGSNATGSNSYFYKPSTFNPSASAQVQRQQLNDYIDSLASKANSVKATGPTKTGFFERDFNVGQIIGKTGETTQNGQIVKGISTTWYRVVQDKFGGIITMHPIPAP